MHQISIPTNVSTFILLRKESKMDKITTPKFRKIIDDFAEEIKNRKRDSTPPKYTVINFRNEKAEGRERKINLVPIELLRYRKGNGRIASDVMHYEKINGLLNESDVQTQKIIARFLEEKDKERTEDLKNSIFHSGQMEPTIITCDGFLINGNRRKMVMEKLLKKYPGEEKFKSMKVVILPGKDTKDGTGGPPTLIEIEQIENRYQLQKEAKAEYYGFDRALSIRRKEQIGMKLEVQMKDDPVYASLSEKEFMQKLKKMRDDYLKPLECIDRYLENLNRPGLYSTVSRSVNDPEGRWQAFLDYYKYTYSKIKDPKTRIKLGLEEEDIGKVEDVAFKIIRKRSIKDLPKLHMIIRILFKYISHEDSKKELFKLIKIKNDISESERYDKNGNELEERDIDRIWGKKYEEMIIRHMKNAKHYYDHKKIKETPIQLLEASLNKLNHDDMDPNAVEISEIPKALKICNEIKKRANELGNKFFKHQKQLKKITRKF